MPGLGTGNWCNKARRSPITRKNNVATLRILWAANRDKARSMNPRMRSEPRGNKTAGSRKASASRTVMFGSVSQVGAEESIKGSEHPREKMPGDDSGFHCRGWSRKKGRVVPDWDGSERFRSEAAPLTGLKIAINQDAFLHIPSGTLHSCRQPQQRGRTIMGTSDVRPPLTANQRRSQRILLSVALRVSGKRLDGSPF